MSRGGGAAAFDQRNPANAGALRSFDMQNKIRQDTMRLNDQFADLARWEKTIKKKDEELELKGQAIRQQSVPIRGRGSGGGGGGSRAAAGAGAETTRTVRTRMGGGAVSAPIEELQKQQGHDAAAAASAASTAGGKGPSDKTKSAAAHTYDKGYVSTPSLRIAAGPATTLVPNVRPPPA
jgi:hypothetical protein